MTERREEARSFERLPGRVATALGAGLLVMAFAPSALAYVGPGAGVGVLGILFGIIMVALASIVGLVLWPVRALTRRFRAKAGTAGGAVAGSAPPQSKEAD
jgi:hypothetical protein